jgi:hypothetical protein
MSLNNEDIKQLIEILQRGLTSDDSSGKLNQSKKNSNTKSKRSATNKKSSENTPTIDSKNKFDRMLEKSMHLEDIEVDKKLCKHPPSLRTRGFALTKATCRICGKSDQINPALVNEGRYKCNKCAREPG